MAFVAGRNNSRYAEGKADRARQRREAVLPIRPVQERIENLSVRLAGFLVYCTLFKKIIRFPTFSVCFGCEWKALSEEGDISLLFSYINPTTGRIYCKRIL